MLNRDFSEKLKLIRNVIFYDKPLILSEEYISVEKRLGTQLPKPLKDFYMIFSEESDFLKCMYDIAAPEEIVADNGILVFVKENQNVCGYGIELQSQKLVYLDESNNIKEAMEQSLDDFLLYLLALQCTEYLPSVGILEAEHINTLERFMERITISKEDGAVYYIIDKAIGVRAGNEIYVCMRNDDDLEEFENNSGLMLDWL